MCRLPRRCTSVCWSTVLATGLPSWFIPAFCFVLGLLLGSFLNVVIYRVPLARSIVRPGSACPECGHAVRAYDNIPLVSWLLLRGRCRDCKSPISARYPAVELACALLFLDSALHFSALIVITKTCILSFLMLALIFTDLDHQILPDALTLPGMAVGFAFAPMVYVEGLPGLRIFPHSMAQVRALSLFNSLIGAAVGAGLIYLVGEIYWRLRGVEAMGFGDVKLMGLIGAFLGTRLALLTIFVGSAAGAIAGVTMIILVYLRRRSRYGNRARAWHSAKVMYSRFPLPFGVFLGSAALLNAFWGDRIIQWYFGLF